ncbi:Iron-regulated protein FrpC, putative (fragment) [Planktothrix paucivesiculata PCC 9631]|uniref:Iron-regulated protein FrpC, putative n=2 Tax=Planktothrix TaxID=54304 RepID=A0A7Z9BND5_9CYAN
MGSGDDLITGEATISNNWTALFNSQIIDMGNGSDTITGSGGAWGLVNDGTINTGNGEDIITGAGSFRGIENNGTIDTGAGKDTVDALTGGFRNNPDVGNGMIILGNGNDELKGFGSGRFDGGNGNKDEIFLGQGSYSVSGFPNADGFYTVSYQGIDMFVKNFELISIAGNPATTFGFSEIIGKSFLV